MTHGFDTSFLVAAEVEEHPAHKGVRRRIESLRGAGDSFGLIVPVMAEFIHIVTDARRFTTPLTMPVALTKARSWWDAAEVIHIEHTDGSADWFFQAIHKYQLGRKRLLDTAMAAAYRGAGISSLLTLNSADFTVFGEFTCLGALEVES